jgi:hypothetical protein
VILDNQFETGLRFGGDEGLVFCTRGEEKVTASDPNAPMYRDVLLPLRASDPKILLPLERRCRALDAEQIASRQLARKHCCQPPTRRQFSNPPTASKPAPPHGSA